ncbi:MAG TPA: hypothetical protein VFN78_07330 [Ktedonobacterales bacterium]|nr:hypothetical protein [Ktedonobacterales bacterium]
MSADEGRDADGRPQPLPVTAAQVGDWACGLLHCWPASAFPAAANTTAAAPKCPACTYPLWRVKAIGDETGETDGAEGDATPLRVRVQFEERDR